MVIFLPLVVLFLVLGLLSGNSNLIVVLPMVFTLGVGAVFVTIALRDGRKTPDWSVRRLPTDHLRRQMHLALKPRRPGRQRDGDGPRRAGGSDAGKDG